MGQFKSDQLINTLEQSVNSTISYARALQSIDTDKVCTAPAGKWNVVQILYHLNSYNNYYLQEIERTIRNGAQVPYSPIFKPGIIGNYFTNAMLPGNNGTIKNAMKAPADHVPDTSYTDVNAINEFIKGQQRLLDLLRDAQKVNMTRLRVPISISRFIKIRLGDTFRFLIAHQQRHFVQISNTLKANGVALSV